MESRELLEVAGVAVVVATAVAVGTAVAGSVGGLLAGAGAAGAGAHYLKKQQDEQSLLPNRRKESREYNPDHHSSSTVQEGTFQRQQQTQTNPREELRQPYPNPPSPTVQAPPTQRITKQYLVLVVFASQADLLESLQTKRRIDITDGEALYEITKYLWLGSETDFNQRIASIDQYSVSKGEESEYDIYLVYIELNQADERFKSNVDQVDRYDAFRNLADADLEVKFERSPRLQMEAYGNFDVYNR
ncbi:hypothetical protein [Microcoleus vaginatus]|uniref:hypothetical protein n=1 Tax=Microcoleus vaginatus TaxID=119532 RepID=UPI0032A3F5C9